MKEKEDRNGRRDREGGVKSGNKKTEKRKSDGEGKEKKKTEKEMEEKKWIPKWQASFRKGKEVMDNVYTLNGGTSESEGSVW